MFDPMYDSYTSMARRSGATIVPVRLRLPDFSVPLDELAAAVGPRTKMIMINSPHNPSGKVGSGLGFGSAGVSGARAVGCGHHLSLDRGGLH